ncbi:MAG: hypothetical protein P9M14_11130 [Candidatus Alcyoniella australis]|nr:hypothetical protein [Candidatus Alcyoniella australis]
MTWLGALTLLLFVGVMVLTLLRKINMPVQTVLVITTLVILALGAAHRAVFDGLPAVLAMPNEAMGWIILHPITALLAGLFMAGALQISGGFEAFKVLIMALQRVPIIGLAGTLVILIQVPMIASLPCGRIIAAALLPLLFAFSAEGGMNVLTRTQMIVLIGAFSRNAFGSCGPSPIGGVGQIGEGFLGAHFDAAAAGMLRAPQAFALMLGTAVTALFLKFITQRLYPDDVTLRDRIADTEMAGRKVEPPKATLVGYASLVIFVFALLASVFELFGKLPVQTVLAGAAVLIVIISRAGIRDLMAGIILLPVAAMIAGFLAAGALAATGGFDALGVVLSALSKFPLLGVAGMLAIFVQIQTILPLSCSRILTAALVPVLYQFGPAGFNFITWDQLAIAMAAYIINATTSCGPSPLGGGGMMGEGQMRAESGYIKGAYVFTSMAVMAPLAALYMRFANLGLFRSQSEMFYPSASDMLQLALYAAVVVVATIVGTLFIGRKASISIASGQRWQRVGFLALGAFAGAVLSFSLYGLAGLEIMQGAVGGALAALVISLMVPSRLTPAPREAKS